MVSSEPLLRVDSVTACYDSVVALRTVSLDVGVGEVVAVLGANGAGKSTLLKAIAGLVRAVDGSVEVGGTRIDRWRPAQIVRQGVALVPEGRQVFESLSVFDNLRCGAYAVHRGKLPAGAVDHVFDLFPRLAERRNQLAGTLSGGEQQMVAIGRALLAEPRLLLLDEPSMGLAPVIVHQIFEALRAIVAEHSLSMLLVEQNARVALELAGRGYLLEGGVVIADGTAADLDEAAIRAAYLGETGNVPQRRTASVASSGTRCERA